MSIDYAIWKRSPTAKTACIGQVYESLCGEKPHPAMAYFQVNAVMGAIREKLGNGINGTIKYEVCVVDDPQNDSAGIIITTWADFDKVVQEILVQIAVQNNLMVYDPQCDGVWNNRRKY